MIDSTNTDQDVLFSPLWKNAFSPLRLCSKGGGVPSLVSICLQCIVEFPDQIQLHHKLVYQPPQPPLNDIDRLLASMLTGRCGKNSDKRDKQDLSQLDPRLWAVIVQIFDCLPSGLRTYTISLNDEALPLLQRIPSTATFSLMTILELPGCVALNDSSISHLKDLHTLTAFDASCTRISSYGLLSLARTLQTNDSLEATRRLRGPWALRILRLKHCTGIDDAVYTTLPKFSLLSVVDLRGTSCHSRVATLEFAFSPNADRSLFSSNMIQSLKALQNHEKDSQMHSATKEYQFALRIKTLCHETIAKSLSQKNDRIGYRFRSPLHQSSPISADDYNLHWTDENRSDQYSQESGNEGEESDFNDIEEQGELGGNVSDEREEQASDKEVNDGTEEQEARVTGATKQLRALQERRLNESQKVADGLLVQRTMDFRDRQKPHWYDADWARANTYVPMSLVKGKDDSKLMLYRPMRPWNLLESELHMQLAKEARRDQIRTDGHNHSPDLIAPLASKNLQVQENMKSMTAEALRRRQIHNPSGGNEPIRMGSRNPFARKPTEVPFSVMQNSGQPKGKPLKPISALRVPKIPHEHLQQTAKRGSHSAGPENRLIQPSTIAKNNSPAAKLPTRGSLAFSAKNSNKSTSSVSADLGEGGTKRKMIRRSERISMSSSSMVFNPVPPSVKEGAGGKGGQKTHSPSFDWTAWASKKS